MASELDEAFQLIDAINGQRPKTIWDDPLRRAISTQKPQIVEAGILFGQPYVLRAHPLNFNWTEFLANSRDDTSRREAARFLHSCIRGPLDWEQTMRELSAGEDRAEAVADWRLCADLRRAWGSHEPQECFATPWSNLESQFCALYEDTDLGDWCVWLQTGPDGIRRGACVFWEGGRRERRGRPSLKWEFYQLAARFVQAARNGAGGLPSRFFDHLARYLSFPELGIAFTAHELRSRCHERAPARTRGAPHARGTLTRENASLR